MNPNCTGDVHTTARTMGSTDSTGINCRDNVVFPIRKVSCIFHEVCNFVMHETCFLDQSNPSHLAGYSIL